MQPLALAKRRSSLRAGEAGVAMFIVTMMMTVLATVGLFALAASSTEVKTAGNERQSTQTHYLAEYGVVAITHEVKGATAQAYLGMMISKPDTCISLPIPSTVTAGDVLARACRRVENTELQTLGNWSAAPTVAYSGSKAYQNPTTSTTVAGSLGPIPTNAGFFVELTDPTQTGAPPRYSTDLQLCFIQLTATSAGVTSPTFGGNVAYDDMGVEMQRARIVAGPIQCPK
jgi:hypothetical protein